MSGAVGSSALLITSDLADASAKPGHEGWCEVAHPVSNTICNLLCDGLMLIEDVYVDSGEGGGRDAF